MRILVVASFNKGRYAPFIVEQSETLKNAGCEVSFFGLQGKGVLGYLKNLSALKMKIKEEKPDVIHAHYGLSGLLANLQRRVPVVTTYHGSDINDKKVLLFSRQAMRFSAWNIFVSRKTMQIVKPKRKYSLLPCGIDLTDLQLTERQQAKQQMHLDADKKYILFAGAFDNAVKNATLAKESVALSREQVTLLMCAVDAFFMTSLNEGSPQVIKEALACGCPIVSVDVGDVKERIEGVEGCYVASSRESKDLAALLQKALAFEGKTSGRDKVVNDGLDNREVAKKLMKIYESIS